MAAMAHWYFGEREIERGGKEINYGGSCDIIMIGPEC
jgi:hypothetical protein